MALEKEDESVPKQTLGTKPEQVGQLLATCFITRKAQATTTMKILVISINYLVLCDFSYFVCMKHVGLLLHHRLAY